MLGEGGVAPSPSLEKLLAAFEDFARAQEEPAHGELGDELIALAHLRDRLDVVFSRKAAAFALSDEYGAYGYISPVAWLRCEAKMATGVASERVTVGLSLGQVPSSLAALERGEIGFKHLALIARTADMCGRDARFDESRLLEKATEQSVTRFR